MLLVSEVLPEVQRVLGGVSDTEALSRLNHAVDILSVESEWDPMLGYIDVCVCGDRFVTLPHYVGTVLSVAICGVPAQGHDRWFKFHLNGPGMNFTETGFHWVDGFPVCTFREPPRAGSYLGLALEAQADQGKEFRVFGFDVDGNWIRSGGKDGWLVPTTFGSTAPGVAAPAFRKVTRIAKPGFTGLVRLYTVDQNGTTSTQIGEYFPHENVPQYRRIQVSQPGGWARIAFRRTTQKVSAGDDLIPLHSTYALLLMVKALKKFDEDRFDEGYRYKAAAVNFLTKKQESLEVPGGPSVQMATANLIASKRDRMDM